MVSKSKTRKKVTLENFPDTTATVVPVQILKIVEKHYPSMSPGQRAVADFISNNPTTFCFLSVQELAAKALVSHATVIRFCKTIGYQGFYEFSHEVQQAVQQGMQAVQQGMPAGFSPTSHFDIVQDFLDSPKNGKPLLQSVLDMEIQSLMTVAERVRMEDIMRCVDLMVKADHIFVLGQMGSWPLAIHMEHMLSKVTVNVHLVPPKSVQNITMLQRVTPKSVLLAYAFPRYPTATIDFARQAAQKKCVVIGMTNSPLSPLAKIAQLPLYIPVGVLSYVDLYAAPMAVSTMLALEFSHRFPERTEQNLSLYDQAVQEQRLFTAK